MSNEYIILEPHNAVKLIATDSAADVLRYVVPFKCELRQIQAHVLGTEATALVVKADKRPTAGSDTGRGDGDLGSITFGASNLQGKVLTDTPTSRLTLDRGEEMVLQVTTASTCDKAVAFEVLVERIAEVDGNNSDISESA